MTTLVYHKDVIAGDSLQFIASGNNSFPLRGPKVFLSKNKTFAYGMCGNYVLEEDFDTMEAWIEKQLINFKNKGVVEPLFKKGHGFYLVIMTKKGTYCINHDRPNIKITQINSTDYYVHGTGGDHASFAIAMGADAIDAVKAGIKRDTASGCDIYAVKRGVLKAHKEI